MFTIETTAIAMAGGAAAGAGVGKAYRFTFAGTWATGDEFTVTLTDSLTAQSVTLGSGTVTGLSPSFVLTFDDKVYVLAGTAFYFSDLEAPTVWNDPQAFGNGFVEMANNFGTPEDLVALAPYQGKLLVIGRRICKPWGVDPDPANYQKGQTILNVGTPAKRSVAAVGDMDVYMLADNGVRSVRVRDASNNAIVVDIGTPIDELVQDVLDTLTDAEKAAACGVVEPSSNRYWLYIPGHSGAEGKIYVFSNFISSSVAAWGTYRATYNNGFKITITSGAAGGSIDTIVAIGRSGGFVDLALGVAWNTDAATTAADLVTEINSNTASSGFTASRVGAVVTVVPSGQWFASPSALVDVQTLGTLEYTLAANPVVFTPTEFAVYNGRVYARSGDDVFIYGGSANQSYDNCGVQWDSPFLNAKTPATRKSYSGVDAACEGRWTVKLGSKPSDPTALTTIYDGTDSTFERGKSLAGKQGTHFKVRGVESGDDYARFSGAIIHFEGGEDK